MLVVVVSLNDFGIFVHDLHQPEFQGFCGVNDFFDRFINRHNPGHKHGTFAIIHRLVKNAVVMEHVSTRISQSDILRHGRGQIQGGRKFRQA